MVVIREADAQCHDKRGACIEMKRLLYKQAATDPIRQASRDRRPDEKTIVPVLALLTAYPAMEWLVASPSFTHLLVVELWFSALFGFYNGAMIPLLVEMMPASVRTAGFSLAYSLRIAGARAVVRLIVQLSSHLDHRPPKSGAIEQALR